MDWSGLLPKMTGESRVEFADVGCGYGGLLVALAPLFPDTFMLGMEIRTKVSDYVQQRIVALRANATNDGHHFDNIAILRSNAMKFLPNLFEKGQLKKMFFLFPDPHFKKKKHKARIISTNLLAEYAYVLAPGGKLYVATDVYDLFIWMKDHLSAHPLFERVPEEELSSDPVVPCVLYKTEEGLKVEREGREKFIAVFIRKPYS